MESTANEGTDGVNPTGQSLEVVTLRETPRPEQLVCEAARGDYYDGFVGEDSFEVIMADVSYDDEHLVWAESFVDENGPRFEHAANEDHDVELTAKTYAFLERLFRRGHFGPFEHPQITIGVKGASRTCMAQITRHRHVSFDVQSQRYVDFSSKENPAKTPKSLTDPDHFSRETGEVELNELDREFYEEYYEETADELFDLYENMVANGVPKEDARFVLPSGTKVNWTMSLNARALLHLADMRATAEAQWEIRNLTNQVLAEARDWMPLTFDLWDEHGPHRLAP